MRVRTRWRPRALLPRRWGVRLPGAAVAVALVAAANALTWSLLIPAFQVPDENAHVAYTQYFAETGKLPHATPRQALAPEEEDLLSGLRFYYTIGHPRDRPPWTQLESRAIAASQRRHLSRVGPGDALSATNNPPLYYALEAVPYKIASSGSLLDRLFWMRLLSVLMSTATVVAIFVFLRELLPRTPWAWTTGALAAAFQPLFGFMSGGVNSDNLLYLGGALVLLAIARAFRRGLTPARGAALGGALAVALLSKATALGLVPAVGLALLALVWRARDGARREALTGAGAAVLAVGVPMGIYFVLAAAVWDRAIYQGSGYVGPAGAGGRPFLIREQLSYLWQFYLPRLPFMNDLFGNYPLWSVWIKGFVGRFGWLDYGFPGWVYDLATAGFAAIAALALAGIARARAALAGRLLELVVYLAAVAGVVLVIAVAGYRSLIDGAGQFEQARYLLPLLGLYAAVVALAARALGRRWGPVLGAGLVLVAFAHDLFAQLLTVSRFYG